MVPEEAVEEVRRKLHLMPKAELHVHLDGSLRPETMLALGEESGVSLPAAEPGPLGDYMHVRAARDLTDYLARFELTVSVMQTAGGLERIAFELAEDLARENVRYAEIRFSPLLNTRRGLSLERAVEAALRGLQNARRTHGIHTGLILCALRHLPPRRSLELAELAVSFAGRGVVGFDLAGPEDGHPPRDHVESFRLARAHNLGVTIHAGEAYGPESIHQAVQECGAHRIGHGTRLLESPGLAGYVRDFRVPLEICLTSNVQTRAVPGFGEHPVRSYYDAGMVLSLNSDNRLMSATSVTEEYFRAHRHLGFDLPELAHVSLMAFAAAFLPLQEKRQVLARAVAEMTGMFGDDVLGPARRAGLLL